MATFNLTPREIEILVGYVKESKGEVDWNKVAAASNCKTAKYARDKFALIRNKLTAAAAPGAAGEGNEGEREADGGNATPGGKAKKKSTPKTTPRKRKTDATAEEDSPTKKTPKTKKSSKTAKDSDDEDSAVKEEPNSAGELMEDMAV